MKEDQKPPISIYSVQYSLQHIAHDRKESIEHRIKISFPEDQFISKCINLYALELIPEQHYNNFEWHINCKSIELVQRPNTWSRGDIDDFSDKQRQINEVLKQIMGRIQKAFQRMKQFIIKRCQLDEYCKLSNLLQIHDFQQLPLVGVKVIRTKTQNFEAGDAILYYCNLKEEDDDRKKQNKFEKTYDQLFRNPLDDNIYFPVQEFLEQINPKYHEQILKYYISKLKDNIIREGFRCGFVIRKIGAVKKQVPADNFDLLLDKSCDILEKEESQKSYDNLNESDDSSSNTLISMESETFGAKSQVSFSEIMQNEKIEAPLNNINFQEYQPVNRVWEIGINLLGKRKNLCQFYKIMHNLMSGIHFTLFHLNQVKGMLLPSLRDYSSDYNFILINHQTLLFEKTSKTQLFIANALKIGQHLILTKDLPEETIQFLIKKQETKKMKQFLQSREIFYSQFDLTKDRIIMKSNEENFNKFLECMNSISEQNKNRELVEYDIFKNSLQIQTFLKYYSKAITHTFYVTFLPYETNSDHFKLYFSCVEKDKEKIINKIKQIRDQMLVSFVYISSLAPIASAKIKINEKQLTYRLIKNPATHSLKFIKSTKMIINQQVNLVISPFTGFASHQEQLVIFVHRDAQENSKIVALINETIFFEESCSNTVHIQILRDFIGQNLGKSPERIKKVVRQNNRVCRNFYLVFVDLQDLNPRHVQRDLELLLRITEDKLINKFMFPSFSKKLINEIFMKLITKVQKLSKTKQIVMNELHVYLEEYDAQLKYVESATVKAAHNSKLLTHNYFTHESLARIENMDYYKMFYFKNNETYNLSGWGAFFFNYQIQRINKMGAQNKKAALSLPSHSEQEKYHPILINFRQNQAYFLEKKHQIISVKFILKNKNQNESTNHTNHGRSTNSLHLSKELQVFISVLNRYFPYMEFFVAFCQYIYPSHKQSKQIGHSLCTNLYYTFKNDDVLYRLKFDAKNKKLSVIEKQIIQKFIINKQTYLEWFLFQVSEAGVDDLLEMLGT